MFNPQFKIGDIFQFLAGEVEAEFQVVAVESEGYIAEDLASHEECSFVREDEVFMVPA